MWVCVICGDHKKGGYPHFIATLMRKSMITKPCEQKLKKIVMLQQS